MNLGGRFGLVCLVLIHPCCNRLLAWEANPPQFDLYTADGLVATGSLEQLKEDWSLKLGGTNPRTVAAGDFIALRRSKTLLPAFPRQAHAAGANGRRVPGPDGWVKSR